MDNSEKEIKQSQDEVAQGSIGEAIAAWLGFLVIVAGVIFLVFHYNSIDEESEYLQIAFNKTEEVIEVEIVGVELTPLRDMYSFYDGSNLISLSHKALFGSSRHKYSLGEKIKLDRRSYIDEDGVINYYEYKGISKPYYVSDYNNASYSEKVELYSQTQEAKIHATVSKVLMFLLITSLAIFIIVTEVKKEKKTKIFKIS